jgi:hypothetical protein
MHNNNDAVRGEPFDKLMTGFEALQRERFFNLFILFQR